MPKPENDSPKLMPVPISLNNKDKKRIADYRFQIDALDMQVLNLLNRRAELSLELEELKQRARLRVPDTQRETQIVNRIVEVNPGPLDSLAVLKIFGRILRESRRLQKDKNISNPTAKNGEVVRARTGYEGR